MDNMDVNATTVGESIGETYETSLTSINWPKIIFSIIICVFGLVGNIVVIFVILVLKEYRKSVTNWYVLQLAIADSLFLLTLPFKTTEDINKRWIHPEWMCKAKETILFLNYYASIVFLMVMSIDRYIAVCHTFSDTLQKFRKPLSAYSITVVAWIVCLCLCVPVMLYSAMVGTYPHCDCSYVFPSPEESNITKRCIDQGFSDDMDLCRKILTPTQGGTKYCKVPPDIMNDIFNYEASTEYHSDSDGNFSSETQAWHYPDDGSFNEYFSGAFPTANIPEDLTKIIITNETINETAGAYDDVVEEMLSDGIPRQCSYKNTPTGWKVFLVFNFVVMYVLPVTVMVVCYGLIIKTLRSSKIRSNSTVSVTQSNGKKRKTTTRSDKDRRRVTIMCTAMVSTFVLLWLLFHVNHLAKLAGINVSKNMAYICDTLPIAGSLLAYLNSALNPYIYSFLGSHFKKRWNSAARSLHTGYERRRSSTSGTTGVKYIKKAHKHTNDGSTSNTGTVMTKMFRSKSEKNGSLSETKHSLDSTHAI